MPDLAVRQYGQLFADILNHEQQFVQSEQERRAIHPREYYFSKNYREQHQRESEGWLILRDMYHHLDIIDERVMYRR